MAPQKNEPAHSTEAHLASALLEFRSAGANRTSSPQPVHLKIDQQQRQARPSAVPQSHMHTVSAQGSPNATPTVQGLGSAQRVALTLPSGSHTINPIPQGGMEGWGSKLVQLLPSPATNAAGLLSVLDVLRGGQANQSQTSIAPVHLVHQTNGLNETIDNRQRSGSFIRKEQVEAALKSKPQRGRKREDLSDMERVELTRTRNREHARTTRIRKKARYEQLIEEERCLHQFQEKAAMEKQRRSVVMQFIILREQMLTAIQHQKESSSSRLPIAISPALFQDCVENMDKFSWEVGEKTDTSVSSFDRMVEFDRDLASRIRECLGDSSLSTIQYSVSHGNEGVSLDCCDGGSVEVDVAIPQSPRVTVLRGFLRFQFAGPQATKLSSVYWSTTKNYLDREADLLNAQISHPSVVSLDPAVAAETAATEETRSSQNASDSEANSDGQFGPGMSI